MNIDGRIGGTHIGRPGGGGNSVADTMSTFRYVIFVACLLSWSFRHNPGPHQCSLANGSYGSEIFVDVWFVTFMDLCNRKSPNLISGFHRALL